MFARLDSTIEKYDELSMKVADPAVISNQPEWQKLMKEMGEMEPIVREYKLYKQAQADLADAREIFESEDDEEMREMAREEVKLLESKIAESEETL